MPDQHTNAHNSENTPAPRRGDFEWLSVDTDPDIHLPPVGAEKSGILSSLRGLFAKKAA